MTQPLTYGIYPREMNTYIHKKIYTWVFIIGLSIRTKIWNIHNINYSDLLYRYSN